MSSPTHALPQNCGISFFYFGCLFTSHLSSCPECARPRRTAPSVFRASPSAPATPCRPTLPVTCSGALRVTAWASQSHREFPRKMQTSLCLCASPCLSPHPSQGASCRKARQIPTTLGSAFTSGKNGIFLKEKSSSPWEGDLHQRLIEFSSHIVTQPSHPKGICSDMFMNNQRMFWFTEQLHGLVL